MTFSKSNSSHSPTIANSTLLVKASGSLDDQIINDLLLENGKSIAELLDDQKKQDHQST
jgi:hypothetical protein